MPSIALGDDLRLADHEFVTFAPHHLDQNGKLQFAAAQHLERIGGAGVFDAQRNVGQQLFFQALAQIARGDVGAVLARERRGVHREQHGDGRLVDGDVRQRRRILGVGNGLADGDAFDARDGDDVAEFGFGDVGALQSGERKQFGDLGFLQCAVELGDGNVFAGVHRSVEHARDGEASEIVAVIEIRDQNLQRARCIALGEREWSSRWHRTAAADLRRRP